MTKGYQQVVIQYYWLCFAGNTTGTLVKICCIQIRFCTGCFLCLQIDENDGGDYSFSLLHQLTQLNECTWEMLLYCLWIVQFCTSPEKEHWMLYSNPMNYCLYEYMSLIVSVEDSLQKSCSVLWPTTLSCTPVHAQVCKSFAPWSLSSRNIVHFPQLHFLAAIVVCRFRCYKIYDQLVVIGQTIH